MHAATLTSIAAASVPPVRTWHICLSGFLQHEGTPNGVIGLARALDYQFGDADTRVESRCWRGPVDPLAEWIWRLRPRGVLPRIAIHAYSWGGATAMQLADALRRRGLVVDWLNLSDPVYRHGYWLGQWRAFYPDSVLAVPDNVRRVRWYRQEENWPRAHTPVAEDPRATRIENGIRTARDHQYMDDLSAWHHAAFEIAEELRR